MCITTLCDNKNKEYILNDVCDFELRDIFECGQCFRWKKEDDGSYTGVIKGGIVNVTKKDNFVKFEGKIDGDFEEICRRYFDLNRNYTDIKEKISKDDENMQKAIEYGKGIRILNQDPWKM